MKVLVKILVPFLITVFFLFLINNLPKNNDNKDPLSDNKLTIAWIPKALNNPVFEVGYQGAIKKASELSLPGQYKVEVLYVGPVSSDAAEQVRILEDVIAKGVDAIGISCNDPTALIDPINKAIASGIKVMTWDSDSPLSKRFTYLGVDNYEGGSTAAELLIKNMGTTGKVAILTGVPGAFNLEERIRGFKDRIKDCPEIKIIKIVACNDDINYGVQLVEETMQTIPDLNGWFFAGMWPLFAQKGSMPLWEEASINAECKTVCFDTLPVELEYMIEGYIVGLVGQKYWSWGYDTIQILYDIIVNEKKYNSFINTGIDIVTSNNVYAMKSMWDTKDFSSELPPAF